MDKSHKLIDFLRDLTGQEPPFPDANLEGARMLLDAGGDGLGWSQLNEVLLLLGYDRVTSSFFQFLVDGGTEYHEGSSIASLRNLEESIERFQKLALLIYGNVKYAFKTLSRDPELLAAYLSDMEPVAEEGFTKRHNPVLELRRIPPERTYLLGYLVKRELDGHLERNPSDEKAQQLKLLRKRTIEDGIFNQEAYLCSDHLDVYVATSMRERHEYLFVSRVTKKIFEHDRLKPLNLRWFDPTQAYCPERIDKGLAEALMLKRAECTIYLAQESETLGKDSELASTLAQGKPVIAYVPEGIPEEVDLILKDLRNVYPEKTEVEILMDQLRIYNPKLAWESDQVREWLANPSQADPANVRQLLEREVRDTYDRSADTLKAKHPLGIQVNLSSGVANGVLVVRTIDDCAELVRRVVTRTMEFELEHDWIQERRYTLLKEKISGCVFRVVTGDEMLTNVFWNYYLD
ncbi:MAG: hypothetical protein GXP47_00725 [Acidobacteria bacterium]|nr:hypothetical protein [Acidobacteriota bacterium]